jgi:hypothetical protein
VQILSVHCEFCILNEKILFEKIIVIRGLFVVFIKIQLKSNGGGNKMPKIFLNGFPEGPNTSVPVIVFLTGNSKVEFVKMNTKSDENGIIVGKIPWKYRKEKVSIFSRYTCLINEEIEKPIDIRGVFHTFSFRRDRSYLQMDKKCTDLFQIDLDKLKNTSESILDEFKRRSRYKNTVTKVTFDILMFASPFAGLFIGSHLSIIVGFSIALLSYCFRSYLTGDYRLI